MSSPFPLFRVLYAVVHFALPLSSTRERHGYGLAGWRGFFFSVADDSLFSAATFNFFKLFLARSPHFRDSFKSSSNSAIEDVTMIPGSHQLPEPVWSNRSSNMTAIPPRNTVCLDPTINILFTFSATLGEGTGLVRNLVPISSHSRISISGAYIFYALPIRVRAWRQSRISIAPPRMLYPSRHYGKHLGRARQKLIDHPTPLSRR